MLVMEGVHRVDDAGEAFVMVIVHCHGWHKCDKLNVDVAFL